MVDMRTISSLNQAVVYYDKLRCLAQLPKEFQLLFTCNCLTVDQNDSINHQTLQAQPARPLPPQQLQLLRLLPPHQRRRNPRRGLQRASRISPPRLPRAPIPQRKSMATILLHAGMARGPARGPIQHRRIRRKQTPPPHPNAPSGPRKAWPHI